MRTNGQTTNISDNSPTLGRRGFFGAVAAVAVAPKVEPKPRRRLTYEIRLRRL